MEDQNILLLVDNASSHKPGRDEEDEYQKDGKWVFSNIKVHFLPPNTTSHLQPMDAGIIRSFKAKYRAIHVQHLIDEYDYSQKIDKIDILDALQFLVQAWRGVTETTITNCWKKTGIIPGSDTTTAANDVREKERNGRMEINDLLSQWPENDRMSAEEWLNAEEELGAVANRPWTLDEVADMYTQQDDSHVEEESTLVADGTTGVEKKEEMEERWTVGQMKKGIEQLENYWLRQEQLTLADEERVKKNYMATLDMLEELKIETRTKQKQSTLTNFFTPN